MKTLIVPKFDNNLKFVGYKKIEIEGKPDFDAIIRELPGIPQGSVDMLYMIFETGKPVHLKDLFDPRQGTGLRKLKNFYIAVLQ